ncbi:hypothetical protein ILT44_11905 [Microvirga sp. BT689]|uniref:hypothetical protein n=1 Tax=Microvirga arvi TaxID=2778731 RepID=UPI00194E0D15|nr:hypothetical protein [Microvirga arvi]MBM6580888.1 hypothetical protein [Microvirga arvi]
MKSDQERQESTDKSLVRKYKQDAFSTTLISLFLILFSVVCCYLVWDEFFGTPPDPRKLSRASAKLLASAPMEFRILFFAAMGSIFAAMGVRFIRKLFANPSVISISPAGIEYEKSSGRKKSISWAEMKDVTFHRGTAQIRGQAASINISLFIHGIGRQEILRGIEQHRPDLIEK